MMSALHGIPFAVVSHGMKSALRFVVTDKLKCPEIDVSNCPKSA
jgi:hypothetical protein